MFEKLEKSVTPIVAKIQGNTVIRSISEGFSSYVGLLIVGSVFLLIACFPIDAVANFFASIVIGDNTLAGLFSKVSTVTFSILGVYCVLGIARSYAKNRGVEPYSAMLTSFAAWLYLMPGLDAGIPFDWIGAKGVFLGMLSTLLVVEIMRFVVNKGWVIKLPDGVPPAVSESFTAMIPMAVVFVIYIIIEAIVTACGTDMFTLIYTIIAAPLQGLTTSYGGYMVAEFMIHFLWWFGIHGSNVVGAITGPFLQMAAAQNIAYFQTGVGEPSIICQQFGDLFCTLGGCGSTLSLLIVVLLVCKSKRLRTIAELALPAGIFQINEPVTFGFPMALNPTLAIPFFLVPLVNVTVAYFSMKLGLVAIPSGVAVAWTCPPIIAGFLCCGWTGAVLNAVQLVLGMVIYAPFIKIYDKKLLEEESNQSTATADADVDLDSITL